MTDKNEMIEEMIALEPSLLPVYVEATSLGDAWFQAIRECVYKGYLYKIDQGSYAGQYRKQLFAATIHITHPWSTPLAPVLPQGLEGLQPTTDKEIHAYCANYLLDPTLRPNEEYKYATWISPQLEKFIPRMQEEPYSNQYCITLGGTETADLTDPPCLRMIDMKVVDGRLNFFVVFRSWDLFAGFPQNMGGLQVLKAMVAELVGLQDGTLTAFSAGLHLYDHVWELAKMRLGGIKKQ